MATYITLVNQLLIRLNEVTLDTAGDGFTAVRNVQALAKDAINNSIRNIVQTGQEFPFLKTTNTQTLTAGTRQYAFPADFASVDWDTFYIKKLGSAGNTPSFLPTISFEEYTQRFRGLDDEGDTGSGISARFNHVVIDGAMMYMMRFRSNDQSAAIHQQNFQDGIRSMRRILMDDPLDVRSTVIQRNKSFSNTISSIV